MTQLETLIQTLCPNGVKYVKLGEVGEFYGGLSGKTKEDFKDGNAKFITYKNIYSNLSLDIDVEDKVLVAEGEKQNTVQYGDVLFTGSSETPDECGMSSVLTTPTDEKLYLNSFCFGWRLFDKSIYLPDFLKHLFRCSSIRKEIGKTASGVTRFNVSKKKMQELQIPLPPLAVQSEIVRILDKFTLYKSELAAELAARLQQYEYYRDQLFTFDDTVKYKKLGEVCHFQNGFSFQSSKFEKVGSPILRITNIKDRQIDDDSLVFFNPKDYKENLEAYKVIPNRIVVAMSGATTGKIGINKSDNTYYLNQRVGMFVPNETILNNQYLYHFLSSKSNELYMMAGGGAQPNLSSKAVCEKLLIPLPPLSEQERIVSILDRFDKLCHDIREGLPAEIDLRQKQYEHYRDRLLTFEVAK